MKKKDVFIKPEGHKNFGRTLIFIVAALILNTALAYVVAKLKLVVFLDTIFTVALTFYAGLIPALIVAILYNPLMTLIFCLENGIPFFWYDNLYNLCGVVIVLITWAFSRNKKEFLSGRIITILYLVLISFSSAMASCFTASFLDTFIRPLFGQISGFGVTDSFSYSFQSRNVGAFLSYLLPRIPITVLDRIICTFTGFGISQLLCKKKDALNK